MYSYILSIRSPPCRFRMIAGLQTPDSGELMVGETVDAMWVDQSTDDLNNEATVYEEISGGSDEIVLGSRTINARAYCSWYNFNGGDQSKKVPCNWPLFLGSYLSQYVCPFLEHPR